MSTNSYVESRNCPSCGTSSELSTPQSVAKVPAENLSNDELKDFFIGFREEQCFFTYNRCVQCGQLYCPKYFSKNALNELYSFMPDNTSVSGERDSARTQKGYVKFFPKGELHHRYLEIGADIGLLANQIQSNFEISEIDAVEPNLGVHKELKSNLNKKVEIYTDVSLLPPNKTYDKIAAIHVFDHLLEPLNELGRIANHMNQNSHLLIVVHNERSILRMVMKKKWPPFCLQHPELYNRKTIRNLLEKSGLKTLKIKRTSNYIGLSHGVKLLQSIGLFPNNTTIRLPRISLPIRLGNLAIIATKQ